MKTGARQLFFLALALALLLVSGCGSKRIGAGSSGYATGAWTQGTRVVASARAQIGKPYRYGGSSPSNGFDCSGLIWWAFRNNGVNVPRTASDQASAGWKVSLSAARPGDILVFKTGFLFGGMHTALYAGNGRFIHSPSSGKRVRMENLSNVYWNPKLVGVRRVIR